jgi:hypothetical protein
MSCSNIKSRSAKKLFEKYLLHILPGDWYNLACLDMNKIENAIGDFGDG